LHKYFLETESLAPGERTRFLASVSRSLFDQPIRDSAQHKSPTAHGGVCSSSSVLKVVRPFDVSRQHVALMQARLRVPTFHRGGVNVLPMDGAVRFVDDSIDLTTWRALAKRAGGEQVPDGRF
jgi:hypothetical protein